MPRSLIQKKKEIKLPTGTLTGQANNVIFEWMLIWRLYLSHYIVRDWRKLETKQKNMNNQHPSYFSSVIWDCSNFFYYRIFKLDKVCKLTVFATNTSLLLFDWLGDVHQLNMKARRELLWVYLSYFGTCKLSSNCFKLNTKSLRLWYKFTVFIKRGIKRV